jgi:transcriptional regulator with XRE-family HTH domain
MSMGYGDMLKKAREAKGYKFLDVQKYLKVDPIYLKAMEEENAAEFERAIYMKLFLKTYAKFLKVNGDEVLALFAKQNAFPKQDEKKKEERATEIVREETAIPKDEKKSSMFEFTVSNPRNLAMLLGGVAGLILIIVLLVMLAGRGGKSVEDKKDVYVAPQQQEILKVTARAKSDVWMKSRSDGKEEDFFLKKGQEKEWKDMDRIVFLVGNAAGVEFIVNGESIGAIGEEGEVINGLVFQAGKNWYIDRNQGFKRDNKPAETAASGAAEAPAPTEAAAHTAAPAAQATPASPAAQPATPAAGGHQ